MTQKKASSFLCGLHGVYVSLALPARLATSSPSTSALSPEFKDIWDIKWRLVFTSGEENTLSSFLSLSPSRSDRGSAGNRSDPISRMQLITHVAQQRRAAKPRQVSLKEINKRAGCVGTGRAR